MSRQPPITFNQLVRALRGAGFEIPESLTALRIEATIEAGVSFEAYGYLGAPCAHDFVQSEKDPRPTCVKCGAIEPPVWP